MEKIIKELNHLKEKLRQWEYEYYALENPSVSDFEYDQALKRLIDIEKEYPNLITSDSPSQRVGGFVSNKFQKVRHVFPMLSLSNAFSKEDLLKFDDDIKKNISGNFSGYFVEPKIDGLSISLIYENGVLVKGITRGDGVIGEDVTVNVKTIKTIPLEINYKKNIEVRGEVFLDKKNFQKMNDSGDKKFANARNAASGTLRNLDSSIVSKRGLTAIMYNIPNPDDHGIYSQEGVINFLKTNKFNVAGMSKLCSNIEAVLQRVDWFYENRESIAYDIDGIVIKYNDISKYDDIGYTSKFPKWAIAYKFPAEVVESVIENIETTVGRTGKINYIAKITPVAINGTMVSFATLHNYEYIKEKDIRIGDTVSLFKAGEIIPKIIEPIIAKRKNVISFDEPEICPSCGHKLSSIPNEIDLYCINENCKGRIIQSIIHFCSRQAMNIEGLSYKIIEKFFKHNIIHSFFDLYELKNKKDIIFNLDLNIKNKSFNNLTTSIEKSKNNSLERLIFALGIKHVGEVASKVLAAKYLSIDNLINISPEELITIDDIGPKMANSIADFFKLENFKDKLEKINFYGINKKYINEYSAIQVKEENKKYMNKTYMITGSFSIPRVKIKDILTNVYKSKCVNSLSSKVDYLIAGNKATESKVADAISRNIKIIQNEFWND